MSARHVRQRGLTSSTPGKWRRELQTALPRRRARQPRSAARIPENRSPHGMRVGLVLGAGGVVGASWLIGALEALESETGWRAADAEYIVGTSAGSVIGTLVASGLPVESISAYAGGRSLDGLELPAGVGPHGGGAG